MLFSVEQVFVGRDETRAPLKTPAWEAKFMTADDSIKCQCAHSGMKSGRFQNSRVCLQAFPSFLPHPPPPPTLLLAPFFTLSLTPVPSSLLQSRTETLAMQARP